MSNLAFPVRITARRCCEPTRRSTARIGVILLGVVVSACATQPSPTETATLRASRTSSPSASASASPSPTILPSPTPPQPPVAGAWESVPYQAAFRGTQLDNVVWTGERFVASGFGAVFLDSVDGRTWHQQAQTWPPGASVSGMTVGQGGIVAVGSIGDRAASWYSSDGLSWTFAPDASSLHGSLGGGTHMSDVTETDSGWLAVGADQKPCQFVCPLGAQSVIWTSTDGLHWKRPPHSRALDSSLMAGVVRGGPGYVAVGSNGKLPSIAVVWVSTNGRTWTRLADRPIFHAPSGTDQTFGASMTGVAAGPDGTIVSVGLVGTQGDVGSALAWWSANGRTWTSAAGERFVMGQLFGVAATPTGFIGTGPSGAVSCRGGIWSSLDGHSWDCVAKERPFTDFAAYSAAGSPDLEIVVGFGRPTSAGHTLAASVWVRPIQ
jgi:hypothetical protein